MEGRLHDVAALCRLAVQARSMTHDNTTHTRERRLTNGHRKRDTHTLPLKPSTPGDYLAKVVMQGDSYGTFLISTPSPEWP
jgi:hypothetical protein